MIVGFHDSLIYLGSQHKSSTIFKYGKNEAEYPQKSLEFPLGKELRTFSNLVSEK